MKDKTSALTPFYAVLKPGGIAAITYMPRHRNATPHDAFQVSAELESVMVAVGFHKATTHILALSPIPAVYVIGRKPSLSE